MINNNKRNTAKEKAKDNKGFPYRKSPYRHMQGELKYKITDDSGKSYGEYRQKVNAWKEIKRLKHFYLRDDFYLEKIR